METAVNDWRKSEEEVAVAPSTEFIRAVAELLETSPEDILKEMGYIPSEELELTSIDA